MTLRPELLQEVVEAIADEVAARVAAQVAGVSSGEQWRLYTLAEVVDMVGRSERWVRERVKRGELPHVKLDGGALAFDLADVRAFARARRVGRDAGEVLEGRLRMVGDPAAGAGSRGGRRAGDRRVNGG